MEQRRMLFWGSIQSRYISMSVWTSPRRLVELAGQSLLKDEALAIAALELLPRELFPPLFTAAFDGRHSQTLKAMVQAWPFTCLPLGVLMKGQQLHPETFKAVLDGLDNLLHHLIGLSNLTHVLYPVPLESYEDVHGTLHLGRLAYLHARLRELLCELGRPSMVWLSANPCPHCGDRTFYDPEPILCPCFMPN
uniref:PRAME nuclear receptor transcriptional regulator n=1 Tax=Mandrillus leucophaeus TaxID=9568 RepID=A0A2K5Y329_MANLE